MQQARNSKIRSWDPAALQNERREHSFDLAKKTVEGTKTAVVCLRMAGSYINDDAAVAMQTETMKQEMSVAETVRLCPLMLSHSMLQSCNSYSDMRMAIVRAEPAKPKAEEQVAWYSGQVSRARTAICKLLSAHLNLNSIN
jgi:hypothetical protein